MQNDIYNTANQHNIRKGHVLICLTNFYYNYHSLGQYNKLIYFSYFSQQIGFGNSCKSYPKQTNCMKCLSLLSGKKNENCFKMSSEKNSTQHMQRVNPFGINFQTTVSSFFFFFFFFLFFFLFFFFVFFFFF